MMAISRIVCHRGNNKNLQVIYLSKYDGYLSRDDGLPYLIWQDSRTGGWNEYGALSGESFNTLAVGDGNSNNLQVVGLRKSDDLPYLIWQSSYDGRWYTDYGVLPCNNTPFISLAMERGDHDSLQVILIGKNDHLPYLIWQDSKNGGWNWYGRLPGNVPFESVTVARGNNDSLQVIGIGLNDHLPYLIWQDSKNGSWNWYGRLPGNVPFESVVSARGDNNNLQVVGIGKNDHLPYLIWQASGNGSWNWFGILPGNVKFESITIARGNNQNLQVVGIGEQNHFAYLIWQNAATGGWNWYGALPSSGPLAPYLAAAQGNSDNLQVVCLEQNDMGPHLFWQSSYNGYWYSLDLSKMMSIKFHNLLDYYFNPYDFDKDGTAEIENLSLLPFDAGYELIDFGKKLIIVLVESRLFENIAGSSYSSEDLMNRLKTYRNDLRAEGFQTRFIKIKVYTGALRKGGKTLLAIRELFKKTRSLYKNFAGSVLVGSFPDAMITNLWPAQSEGMLAGSKLVCYREHGFLVSGCRYDVVLADLDGNWQSLYRESITLDRHTFFVTNGPAIPISPGSTKLIIPNPTIVLNEKEMPTPGPVTLYDTFFIQDTAYTIKSLPNGSTQVEYDLKPIDPEVAGQDKGMPNPVSTPNIPVSRINARSIAVRPPDRANALKNGKPCETTISFSKEEWVRDEILERHLMIDYFDRNHKFRSGAYSAANFTISILESQHYGTGPAQDGLNGLKSMNPTATIPDATILDFIRWLKTPITFRAISTHASNQFTQLLPITDANALLAESEAGGTPWCWINVNGKYKPSFKGDDRADLYLFRTLWENKQLVNICPSLMLHNGCQVDGVVNSENPYNHQSYGTFQNAESLLFYANQLAILCRVTDWNHGPEGFGNKFGSSGTATFGDGWLGFFETWAQKGDLSDKPWERKRSYEWNIVGDWTLRKFY
jgi:hypothetical protein